MKMIKALLLTAAACGSATALPASAADVWDGAGATDTVLVTQFGGVNTTVASGTGFTSNDGLTGTFTTGTGGAALRLDQGNGWNGNFLPGTPLLWNRGSNAGSLTFTFDSAVFGVGALIQANYWGAYTARLLLNDGSFFDVAGVAGGTGDGTAPFVGAKNGVANITGVTFSQVAGAGGNDFAISNLSLLTRDVRSPVPEPATWALLILGFAGIGATMRVQKRRQTVTVRYA